MVVHNLSAQCKRVNPHVNSKKKTQFFSERRFVSKIQGVENKKNRNFCNIKKVLTISKLCVYISNKNYLLLM